MRDAQGDFLKAFATDEQELIGAIDRLVTRLIYGPYADQENMHRSMVNAKSHRWHHYTTRSRETSVPWTRGIIPIRVRVYKMVGCGSLERSDETALRSP